MTAVSLAHTPDVIVLGGGVIGLSSALSCATLGLRVTLVTTVKPGSASPAAAGLLAPTLEHAAEAASEDAYTFAIHARDRYPDFIELLAERTGRRVPLERDGILDVALDEPGLHQAVSRFPEGERLDASSLRAIEPHLAGLAGGVLHPHDGSVDNVQLVDVLGDAVRRSAVELQDGEAISVRFLARGIEVSVAGKRLAAPHVVLAAGAWAATIGGLPRALPVRPMRGQMVTYNVRPIRRPVYGPGGYLVPRAAGGGATLAGSTMEDAGFTVETTADGQEAISRMASALCPSLGAAGVATSSWAGLRPVTPDLLPILGPDPAEPSLLYACGHSRNGVLLAPITGDCIAALATGSQLPYDLRPFSPARFG